MWLSLKRLALGFFLRILTSSLLLMADWNRRKPAGSDPPVTANKTPGGISKKWQLHLVEYTNVSDVEDAEQGAPMKTTCPMSLVSILAPPIKKCSR